MRLRFHLLLFITLLFSWELTQNIIFADNWAVIIGIKEYPYLKRYYGKASDIPFADKDAKDFKNLLVELGGFKEGNINLLINKEASGDNIKKYISDLQKKTKLEDKVIIYFSGHGTQVNTKDEDEEDGLDECIVAYDGYKRPNYRLKSKINGVISDDELKSWIKNIQSRYKAVVLDCCFSGQFDKNTNNSNLISSGLSEIDEDIVYICCSTEGMPQNPLYENSIFTYYLIESCKKKESLTLLEAFECAKNTFLTEIGRPPELPESFPFFKIIGNKKIGEEIYLVDSNYIKQKKIEIEEKREIIRNKIKWGPSIF